MPMSLGPGGAAAAPHVALNMGEAARNATWFTPYYYSIVTFTTLGFGDVVPVDIVGEFVVTFEVILGYLMLGGLISHLRGKIGQAQRIKAPPKARRRLRKFSTLT